MMRKTTMPTLIFSEAHADPIVMKILLKMVPELKALGYEIFFEEAPQGFTVQDVNREFQRSIDQYELLKKDFSMSGLDITDDNVINKFISMLRFEGVDEPSLYLIINTLVRYEANLATVSFLKELVINNINFKSVDKNRNNIKDMRELTEENMMEARDKKMANAYLREPRPVFGRIGLMHAEGLQRNILKYLSHEQAYSRFCFIHIYSDQSILDRVFETRKKNKKFQASLLELPLGMTRINAQRKTENEIIDIILGKIREKQENVEKINRTSRLKSITDISHDKTLRYSPKNTGLSSLYGHFWFSMRIKSKSVAQSSDDQLDVKSCQTTPY